MSIRPGLIILASAVMGCRGAADAPAAAAAQPIASESADANRLGTEVLRLLDQLAEYRGANRGRLPRSIRDLGIDSLTRELARSVSRDAGGIRVTVAFRNTAGHALARCSGGLELLEAAAIAQGGYLLSCTTTSGESRQIEAGGSSD